MVAFWEESRFLMEESRPQSLGWLGGAGLALMAISIINGLLILAGLRGCLKVLGKENIGVVTKEDLGA
jgi:hypothetical protein